MRFYTCTLLCFLILLSVFANAQCISGDCTSGNGTYKFTNGDMYTGEWENGNMEGYGRYDWPDGSFYVGYYAAGHRQGQGKYTGTDGVILEGKFVNGELEANSGCVSGDCANGNGTYKFGNGDLYAGDWKNSMRTGYGRYDWADGSYYIGYFVENSLHGKGSYYAADGSSMIGTFEKNQFISAEPDAAVKDDSEQSLDNMLAEMNAKTKADDLAKSQAVRSASKKDFCSLVQTVVNQYGSDFESLIGPKQESYFDFGDAWYANVMAQNSVIAGINEDMFYGSRSFYNTLFETDEFTTARAKYDEFVQLMNSCTINCCTLVYDTNDFKGDSYQSYLTYWLPFMIGDGYDQEKYGNITIEIELMSNVMSPNWSVIFRVYDLGDL